MNMISYDAFLVPVIVLIQRRLYEQVKNAVPVILNVLTTMCLKSDDEDRDYEKLFHRASGIAFSIRTVSAKSVRDTNHSALLALFCVST